MRRRMDHIAEVESLGGCKLRTMCLAPARAVVSARLFLRPPDPRPRVAVAPRFWRQLGRGPKKKKKKKNKTFPRAGRKVELDAASIEKNRRADRYSRLAAKRRARLTLGTVLWRVNTDYRAFPPLSLSLFSFFSFPLPRLVRIIKSRRASSIRFSAFSQRETGSPVRSPVG